MREEMPSLTARWVAMWRGLGQFFDPRMRLVDDPYGLAWASWPVSVMAAAFRVLPFAGRALFRRRPLYGLAGWLQLRTRIIDDCLRDFVKAGGRQVVILGAGYDARAYRLADVLRDATVFEVDHPATQSSKRKMLERLGADTSRTRFLAWNFESQPVADLPGALAALAHDSTRPTLTICEGVAMYLSEKANADTVAAIRIFSAPQSRLLLNYVDRARIEKPLAAFRLARWAGEVPCFGWDPAELPAWLHKRGFAVSADHADRALAARYFPPALAQAFPDRGGHVALCAPIESPS